MVFPLLVPATVTKWNLDLGGGVNLGKFFFLSISVPGMFWKSVTLGISLTRIHRRCFSLSSTLWSGYANPKGARGEASFTCTLRLPWDCDHHSLRLRCFPGGLFRHVGPLTGKWLWDHGWGIISLCKRTENSSLGVFPYSTARSYFSVFCRRLYHIQSTEYIHYIHPKL